MHEKHLHNQSNYLRKQEGSVLESTRYKYQSEKSGCGIKLCFQIF